MVYSRYYEARDILLYLLKKDLVGPVVEDETISDTWPVKYYSAGILYPRETELEQEDKEEAGYSEEYDQSVSLCNAAYPSSMAISFSLKPGTDYIKVSTKYAWYISEEKDRKNSPKGEHPYNWKREPGDFSKEIDTREKVVVVKVHSGLELHGYLQRMYDDGSKTYTVALVNTCKRTEEYREVNERCYFQPEILVSSVEEDDAIFIEKQLRVDLKKDIELLTMEMLYSASKTFAAGHGCSVDWVSKGDCALKIWTTFIPVYELLQMKPARHTRPEIYSVSHLAKGNKQEVCGNLRELVAAYSLWITELNGKIIGLPVKFHEVARRNIRICIEVRDRIEAGIRLLEQKGDVFRAFQLTNKAMLMQMQKARGGDPKSLYWYPFQLGFILQELSSIENPNCCYRNIVDLLWFPTGGGKTEAYSGLAAFTLFLRRLRAVRSGKSGSGVSILMRYTLRLLTLQQFERASTLICACELLRMENIAELGDEEFGIGLWVGGKMTPNSRKEAAKTLEKVLRSSFDSLSEDEANPCQILKCPWCGSVIKPSNYNFTANKRSIMCSDRECAFRDGLPIYMVDEDIYLYKPALVVSTIDKFARMTWEPKIGALFALDTPDLLPPELIIQDELHLISGPLGTVSGLYEVAIDRFCTRDNIKPKIIASTATVRNAESQILNLYARGSRQFPPQGLTIEDAFFSSISIKEEMPSRYYVGVMSPGQSVMTLVIRVYAILLFATRYLKDLGFPDEVIDSFWSITGYFNSLRELGGAVVRVLDDVQDRFKYLSKTRYKDAQPPYSGATGYENYDELTSRKRGAEIAEILAKLNVKYPSPVAYDFLLASNMISVGLDIGRLGLMIVDGQPKANSEYIQATSRVGRNTPGLVAIVYSAAKSRDRSHFEQFLAYHSSLYRHVEATSVTPFSDRARDRGLHAVLISLCRHLISGLRDNGDAAKIISVKGKAEELVQTILERVRIVDEKEFDSTEEQLIEILREWDRLAAGELSYQKGRSDRLAEPLLKHYQDDNFNGFKTLNSMRNVDVECKVYLEG